MSGCPCFFVNLIVIMRILAVIVFFFFSCQTSDRKKALVPAPIMQQMPEPKKWQDELKASDSAAILLFDKPADPRFFKYVSVTDISSIVNIVNDLDDQNVFQDNQTCKSNGKIYWYGEGDRVFTVYFCFKKSCPSFAVIQNGQKRYFMMSGTSAFLLTEMLRHATRPQSTVNTQK
jgi:hypothetical protein